MQTPPTTTVTLLGGTASVDQYGDPDESTSVLADHVPASLIERAMPTVSTESDLQAVVVRYSVCRVPQGTPVDDLSRVRDERTGYVYSVDTVTQPQHATTPQDIRLDLRRVS
jgi:hypothetical protein